MRALIQRVIRGSVTINGSLHSQIGKGIVILLGIKNGDTEEDAKYLANKCANLRIFDDENKRMNLSVKDVNGEALVVSQFTLYGDTRHGNRPDFTQASKPEEAEVLYNKFVEYLKQIMGQEKVKTGVFQSYDAC
ncbi:D-tyrosyl-tRNA(Tyr) deacylase [Candidatus Kryptobacter tengchongensis]|nr:D-tyrosyl-tRNA(Tyr) deacylase [Candidatus Kryptobacter tengchongensis]